MIYTVSSVDSGARFAECMVVTARPWDPKVGALSAW